MSEQGVSELRVGGKVVASGECVAAFSDGAGPAQVHIAVGNPGRAGQLLIGLARAVSASLVLAGMKPEGRDCLMAAVALELADPPASLPLDAVEADTVVSVELRRGDEVVRRFESPLAACVLGEVGSALVIAHAPPRHLVALAKTLVTTVSHELETPVERAAFLRELVHAALKPENYARREGLAGGGERP
ncbi:MAG: hypothetical protein AB1609_19510 [Bacillota bacterium]